MVVTWTAMLERMFDGAVSIAFDTSLDDLRVEYQHSRTAGRKRRDSCVSHALDRLEQAFELVCIGLVNIRFVNIEMPLKYYQAPPATPLAGTVGSSPISLSADT